MKKFDIVKAIRQNDQIIICDCGSGWNVHYEKINFVKTTPAGKMVFMTEYGKRVMLKADEYGTGEYNVCGKHSNCWVSIMSNIKENGRCNYVEHRGLLL
jgi:hypothetical protein